MPYIAPDGTLQQGKPWGLKYFQDLFWGIIGFVILFFRGLFHLDDPKTKGFYGQAPPPGRNSRLSGNPGRRMGRLGGVSGVAPPPCAPGG